MAAAHLTTTADLDRSTDAAPPRRGLTLFHRVFLVNALILVVDGLLLAVAPPIVHSPPAIGDALVIAAGLLLVLAANYALMREAFRPLHRLRERVAEVQRLGPDQHLPDDSSVREVADLTHAFNGMLTRLEDERHRSISQALAVRERERRRLSHELHDEVGQTLSAALLLLQPRDTDDRDEFERQLSEAAETVRDGLEGARRVAHALRPVILEQLELGSALANLGRSMGASADLSVAVRVPRALPALPADVELAVYRVAQEAMTNVVRHACASHVQLAVRLDDTALTLSVSDDGIGLAPGASRGHGMRGMHERARAVGAELAVRDGIAGGTELDLRVPLPGGSTSA
jgi:two-component system sensor histidine kinase UhpB